MTRSVTHNCIVLLVLGLAVLSASGETAPARGHAHVKAHAPSKSAVSKSASRSARAGKASPTAHASKGHAAVATKGHSAHPVKASAHGHPAVGKSRRPAAAPVEDAPEKSAPETRAGAKPVAAAAKAPKSNHTEVADRDTAEASQLATSVPVARGTLRGRRGHGARLVHAVELSTSRRGSRARLKARWQHAQAEDEVATLRPARLAMPAPLRGSYESLVHQNEMADAEGLERIVDDADLDSRIQQKSLVPVPVSAGLQINQELPENRRYVRPWTARFLTDMAQAHGIHFPGTQLLVTSAVRTVEYQRHLRLVNGNAAAAEGDVASPHLTGGTIDIAKHGLTQNQIAWIRSWLLPLQDAGKIDVEEEFKQACFHISVYKTYAPDAESGRHKPAAPATAEQTADPLPPKGR